MNIPINKGNYGMETETREREFEKNRGRGWEDEYKQYRENWVRYAKEQIVSDYPLLVDIELSSLCGLHCPMCYTISEEFKKSVKTQLMDFELFKKIIDEIGGKVPAIRLSFRGEATHHPKFVDCIAYAKNKGIKEVSFLTSGVKLDEEFFIRVAEAGADWITVSIDGMGEVYEGIRKPLKFQDTYNKIKRISEIKKERGWFRPVIKVQSIWPAISNNAEEFYNTFSKITDYVAFNPLIEYGDKGEVLYEPDFACPQLYQRLVIGSDGQVLLCSNDEIGIVKVGDVTQKSVHDIWHGDVLSDIRKLHADGDFVKCEACRICYVPRKTDDSEKVIINGREIAIRNYI